MSLLGKLRRPVSIERRYPPAALLACVAHGAAVTLPSSTWVNVSPSPSPPPAAGSAAAGAAFALGPRELTTAVFVATVSPPIFSSAALAVSSALEISGMAFMASEPMGMEAVRAARNSCGVVRWEERRVGRQGGGQRS